MIGMGISIHSAKPGAISTLNSAAIRIFGAANILRYSILDDASDGTLATIPTRAGNALSPKSTGRATGSIVLGRRAAVFSAGAAAAGYVASTGCRTQIAVSRWDGSLPFSAYNGMLTSNEVPGLIANTGTSDIYQHGDVYRDAVLGRACDALPHYWAAAAPGATTNEVIVGNAVNNAALNWVGPIWHVLQLSTQATAQQLADYGVALKRYYPFLP